MNAEKLTDCFEYLDKLRVSGITNMLGATPYLASARNLSRAEASEVLSAWIETFDQDTLPAARAILATTKDA